VVALLLTYLKQQGKTVGVWSGKQGSTCRSVIYILV
jgi:hypothetical protein